MKHTPGPWTIEETDDTLFILQGEDSDQIAQVDKAFGNGNAHLIAAAPEMLEALLAARKALPLTVEQTPLEIQINSAIAKARG